MVHIPLTCEAMKHVQCGDLFTLAIHCNDKNSSYRIPAELYESFINIGIYTEGPVPINIDEFVHKCNVYGRCQQYVNELHIDSKDLSYTLNNSRGYRLNVSNCEGINNIEIPSSAPFEEIKIHIQEYMEIKSAIMVELAKLYYMVNIVIEDDGYNEETYLNLKTKLRYEKW